jgi:hypothetical protein
MAQTVRTEQWSKAQNEDGFTDQMSRALLQHKTKKL